MRQGTEALTPGVSLGGEGERRWWANPRSTADAPDLPEGRNRWANPRGREDAAPENRPPYRWLDGLAWSSFLGWETESRLPSTTSPLTLALTLAVWLGGRGGRQAGGRTRAIPRNRGRSGFAGGTQQVGEPPGPRGRGPGEPPTLPLVGDLRPVFFPWVGGRELVTLTPSLSLEWERGAWRRRRRTGVSCTTGITWSSCWMRVTANTRARSRVRASHPVLTSRVSRVSWFDSARARIPEPRDTRSTQKKPARWAVPRHSAGSPPVVLCRRAANALVCASEAGYAHRP